MQIANQSQKHAILGNILSKQTIVNENKMNWFGKNLKLTG